MVLTVSFVVSPETGLCCLRHRHDDMHHRQLGISVGMSGRHDFAVRDRCIRLLHDRVHRIPRPTFVTIAKRPSFGARDVDNSAADFIGVEAEYFSACDWTTQITLIRLVNLRFWRNGHSPTWISATKLSLVLPVIACDKREAFAQGSVSDEAIQNPAPKRWIASLVSVIGRARPDGPSMTARGCLTAHPATAAGTSRCRFITILLSAPR
jgi:hypothetical protein